MEYFYIYFKTRKIIINIPIEFESTSFNTSAFDKNKNYIKRNN